MKPIIPPCYRKQISLPPCCCKQFSLPPASPTTGEECIPCGTTQFPEKGSPYQSPDNTTRITINSGLSDLAQAEIFSHEGYGHDLMKVEGKPSGHNPQTVILPGNQVGFQDTNKDLVKSITESIHETVTNYEENHQK